MIMGNGNYVPPELVEKARKIDLPTYFEMFEPGQLKRLSFGVYCTNEHDSLKMSNGKWFWWSRGVGGKNAIDFLMKCRQYRFQDAVLLLTGGMTHDFTPTNSAGNMKSETEKVPMSIT